MRLGLLAQVALVAAALTLYLLVLGQATQRHQDFNAYLAAAADLWQGHPLYAAFLHHPFPDPTLRPAFIYPPAFAILVAPLVLIPGSVAAIIWLAVCQAALLATLLVVIRTERPPGWATVALLCLTLTFYPLWVDAIQGQANLVILALVTAGMIGAIRKRPAWAAAIGVAAALKLTPLLLLGWLLIERRFREAAWMLGAFGLVTGAGAALRFGDTVTFFSRVLPALAGGTAFYANHSLSGFLQRLFARNAYTDPWLLMPYEGLLATGAAALLCAWWLWKGRSGSAVSSAMAFLPLVPLLSAVTWPHHLVIVLPVIWISIIAVARGSWPLAPTLVLAGISVLMSLLPRWSIGPAFGAPGFRAAQTMDPLTFIAANGLLLGTLVIFLTAPWLLRSR